MQRFAARLKGLAFGLALAVRPAGLPEAPGATFLPARDRSGISSRFRINDLRHTAASLVSRRATRRRCSRRSRGTPASPPTLDLYGHLYPGEMDRYASRLDDAAGIADAAKMRPDELADDLRLNP